MIQGLFETHLHVRALETSMEFYQNLLGLELGRFEPIRRAAFYWIGQRGEAMLGLWEKPETEIVRQHFAFRCSVEAIENQAIPFLKARNLPFHNFLDDQTERPMVFAWMPALSIYFDDPDGHSLEFIAMLKGNPRPELGIVSYQDWLEISKND